MLNSFFYSGSLRNIFRLLISFLVVFLSCPTYAQEVIPIADAHVHYSHDSVELTPPERVIELMQNANLKFALVSSSDDEGTQLLYELAPDLIVPALRPYRRRGETGSWFQDENALAYVESLLAKNTYASIGEFHLFGENADLPIPRRIVELADEYNLILQAHSDAEAVERLLAQSADVKIIWAHSGFEDPEEISDMLSKHDRLWADLAFRSEVGFGGSLGDDWRQLFLDHPDRLMVGTDTYTPERMYFIPEHAENVRSWLKSLPEDVAQNVAWRNAFNLVMPVWQYNNRNEALITESSIDSCFVDEAQDSAFLESDNYRAIIVTSSPVQVSESVSATVIVCGEMGDVQSIELDASMPAHGHGTNYTPEISVLEISDTVGKYQVDGLVMHMPGTWQWDMNIISSNGRETLKHEFILR